MLARYSCAVEQADDEKRVNTRSDVAAKDAFCRWLLDHGYESAQVTAAPADVTAIKDGQRWLFEVKFTRARTNCFGAATLTEWIAAADNPERFRFVIAYERRGSWRFDVYSPDEFLAFSSIPPYKVYFNVPLDGRAARKRPALSKKVHLTKARLRRLREQFEELRSLEE